MKTFILAFLAFSFQLTVSFAQNPLFQHPAGMITPQVVSCYPPQNFTHFPLADSLTITFGQSTPINSASLTDSTFVVMGQQSGWHQGTATYNGGTNTITFKPIKPFFAGELVTTVATKKIQYDSAGTIVPIHGFAWQFYGAVTKQTRATFQDTEHLNPEGFTDISALADMDNDGNIDLLYQHAPGDIIAFNTGNGLNYVNTTLSSEGNIFPADYLHRGFIDIVEGYFSCAYDSNKGNRTFSSGRSQTFNGPGSAITMVDIDCDGAPEIIVGGLQKGTGTTLDTINVYSVIGDSIIKRQSIYVGDISIMSSGDFNNDGAIDVYVYAGGHSEILYNDGAGKLLPPQTITPNVAGGLNAVDMDNDGLLDLVGWTGQGVEIDHNNGDGTFTPFYSNDRFDASRYGFNVGDCDGDGLMDVVYTPVTDTTFIVIARNIGNDQVRVTQEIAENTYLGQGAEVFLGDLDNDGAMDMAISFDQTGTIVILKNDSSVPPLAVVQSPVSSPEGYVLNENFPNPSSNVTNISYVIPTTETVNISIYNTDGQLISTVVNGLVTGGANAATYDCSALPSGVYFIRLIALHVTLTKEFVHYV